MTRSAEVLIESSRAPGARARSSGPRRDFVLRATEEASKAGGGVAILHSHPGGHGWQGMSSYDADAEASYANLVREITGLPLIGMTLAGADGSWSARIWNRGLGVDVRSSDCENVRVVGDRLNVSWNDRLVPRPTVHVAQARTVSCWGPRMQADLARLRSASMSTGARRVTRWGRALTSAVNASQASTSSAHDP